ncbi:hypothetical protein [Pediococcus acidilactici]|uniref:hypothetical protein n=1 Tax=Pediococcus acidilactici TaxID=1254 RepID=UPI00132FBF2F|nr:hypothetical protein [Pediococcus acidilactici]KAF0361404.1 hypothetical protein GBO49_00660 [Pediococcus acidilactici]KAF0531490.1 hypothetical protein GBP35_01340 [Pediococcus acidilactici]
MKLSASNWIQIIGILVSTLSAIISLVIAVKSLKTSQRSIELAANSAEQTKISTYNANRPYVVAYTTSIETGMMSMHKYLIIKNFGKSAAHVSSVIPLSDLDSANKERKLKSLKDFTLAPKMSIPIIVDSNFMDTIKFEIIYNDLDDHKFDEIFEVNFGFMQDIKYATASKSNLPGGFNELIAAINILAQQIQQK